VRVPAPRCWVCQLRPAVLVAGLRRPTLMLASLAAGGSCSPRRRPWPCAMAQLGPVGPVVITGLTSGCPFIRLTKLVGCIIIQRKILKIQN